MLSWIWPSTWSFSSVDEQHGVLNTVFIAVLRKIHPGWIFQLVMFIIFIFITCCVLSKILALLSVPLYHPCLGIYFKKCKQTWCFSACEQVLRSSSWCYPGRESVCGLLRETSVLGSHRRESTREDHSAIAKIHCPEIHFQSWTLDSDPDLQLKEDRGRHKIQNLLFGF